MKRARAAKASSRARWGLVGDPHPDQDAERREGADHERVADVDVAVGVLADRPDQGDDDDHQQRGRLALDLREAEEDGQRRHEEDPPADADQATGEAAGHGDQDRQLSRRRSWRDQLDRDRDQQRRKEQRDGPLRDALLDRGAEDDADTAGIESSRPVRTWTLP